MILYNKIDIITDVIIKCDSYCVTKCEKEIITKCVKFCLLQNSIVITNFDVYYKIRRYTSQGRE